MTKEDLEKERVVLQPPLLTKITVWMGLVGCLGLAYFNYFPSSMDSVVLRAILVLPGLYIFKILVNGLRERIVIDRSRKTISLRRTFGEWELSKANVSEWYILNFYTRWGRGYMLKFIFKDGKKIYYPVGSNPGVVGKIELFGEILGSDTYKGMIKRFDFLETLVPDFLR